MVSGVSAALFVAVAMAMLLALPDERDADVLELAGLVIGYAAISRVRFEFGNVYVNLEQLVFVPAADAGAVAAGARCW